MPAFLMNNVCTSKLVRKCFIQQKQVPPMHIYILLTTGSWYYRQQSLYHSFFKVFIQCDYNIHDSWVQTIHCFTIQTGVMFKVLEY